MASRNMTDQVNRGLRHAGEIRSLAVTHDVHVEETRALVEEVVMQGGHFQTVVEERGHDRVNLILGQHQVSHHHVRTSSAFRHGQPAAKAKGCRRGHAVHHHVKIRTRDVHLEYIRLEIALFVEDFQGLLIFAGHFLGLYSNGEIDRAECGSDQARDLWREPSY